VELLHRIMAFERGELTFLEAIALSNDLMRAGLIVTAISVGDAACK